MLDSKKSKWIIAIMVCVVSIALLLLLLNANAAICINPFDNGGCISVAWDKALMTKTDRIVIRVGDEQHESTDPAVLYQIVSETKVATNTDLRYPNTDRWIDVYCGTILIRSMRWADNHDMIIVYNADARHWVFPSMEAEGMIVASQALIEMLNEIIKTDS